MQALGDTDTAILSTPTVDYKYQPHVHGIEWHQMQERSGHSATPYPVCSFQKQSTYDDY